MEKNSVNFHSAEAQDKLADLKKKLEEKSLGAAENKDFSAGKIEGQEEKIGSAFSRIFDSGKIESVLIGMYASEGKQRDILKAVSEAKDEIRRLAIANKWDTENYNPEDLERNIIKFGKKEIISRLPRGSKNFENYLENNFSQKNEEEKVDVKKEDEKKENIEAGKEDPAGTIERETQEKPEESRNITFVEFRKKYENIFKKDLFSGAGDKLRIIDYDTKTGNFRAVITSKESGVADADWKPISELDGLIAEYKMEDNSNGNEREIATGEIAENPEDLVGEEFYDDDGNKIGVVSYHDNKIAIIRNNSGKVEKMAPEELRELLLAYKGAESEEKEKKQTPELERIDRILNSLDNAFASRMDKIDKGEISERALLISIEAYLENMMGVKFSELNPEEKKSAKEKVYFINGELKKKWRTAHTEKKTEEKSSQDNFKKNFLDKDKAGKAAFDILNKLDKKEKTKPKKESRTKQEKDKKEITEKKLSSFFNEMSGKITDARLEFFENKKRFDELGKLKEELISIYKGNLNISEKHEKIRLHLEEHGYLFEEIGKVSNQENEKTKEKEDHKKKSKEKGQESDSENNIGESKKKEKEFDLTTGKGRQEYINTQESDYERTVREIGEEKDPDGDEGGVVEKTSEKGDLEQIKKELDIARKEYLEIDFKNKKAHKRLAGFFGSMFKGDDREKDKDVAYYRAIYDNKSLDYKNVLLSDAKKRGISNEDLGNLVKLFDVEANLNMADVHDQVKLENHEGRFSGFIKEHSMEIVQRYRKLSLVKKIAIGATFGIAAVGAGYMGAAAVGVVGSAVTARRLFMGVVTGTGVAIGLESRTRKNVEKKIEKESGEFLEKLEKLSSEEKLKLVNDRIDKLVYDENRKINTIKNKNLRNLSLGATVGTLIGSGAFAELSKMGFGKVSSYFGWGSGGSGVDSLQGGGTQAPPVQPPEAGTGKGDLSWLSDADKEDIIHNVNWSANHINALKEHAVNEALEKGIAPETPPASDVIPVGKVELEADLTKEKPHLDLSSESEKTLESWGDEVNRVKAQDIDNIPTKDSPYELELSKETENSVSSLNKGLDSQDVSGIKTESVIVEKVAEIKPVKLIVEKGSSLEGSIIKHLKANPDLIEKYNELNGGRNFNAGQVAHRMALEFAEKNADKFPNGAPSLIHAGAEIDINPKGVNITEISDSKGLGYIPEKEVGANTAEAVQGNVDQSIELTPGQLDAAADIRSEIFSGDRIKWEQARGMTVDELKEKMPEVREKLFDTAFKHTYEYGMEANARPGETVEHWTARLAQMSHESSQEAVTGSAADSATGSPSDISADSAEVASSEKIIPDISREVITRDLYGKFNMFSGTYDEISHERVSEFLNLRANGAYGANTPWEDYNYGEISTCQEVMRGIYNNLSPDEQVAAGKMPMNEFIRSHYDEIFEDSSASSQIIENTTETGSGNVVENIAEVSGKKEPVDWNTAKKVEIKQPVENAADKSISHDSSDANVKKGPIDWDTAKRVEVDQSSEDLARESAGKTEVKDIITPQEMQENLFEIRHGLAGNIDAWNSMKNMTYDQAEQSLGSSQKQNLYDLAAKAEAKFGFRGKPLLGKETLHQWTQRLIIMSKGEKL